MQRISITNPQNIIDGTAKKYYFKLRNTGGPKGDKGDKGDTGATGPQGPQGNAATVSVGSTTTLPVGYDATVENVGSIYNAVLDFGIPQGPRGPQGAKGDKGDTGAKGDTGPRGPQGERGTNATVYIGTTTTLNPGSQATVYNSGTENNAVLNFGIPRGEKGETGATGATGATGPAGQDGQNFTPTIVDSLPTTGDQSKLYLTPKDYTTGTATGNPITITLGEDTGQITSAQLDGDTFQYSYDGGNLFNTTLENGTISSETGADSGSATNRLRTVGYIELVGGATTVTVETSSSKTLQLVPRYYSEDGTYLGYGSLNWQTSPKTLNLPSRTKKMRLVFRFSDDTAISSGQITSISITENPSPSPKYPQQIQTVTGEQTVEVVGKNLFNPTATPWIQDVAYNASGQKHWGGYYGINEYQPVEDSTQYAFSNNLDKPIHYGLAFYDSSKNLISTNLSDLTTFTTPANCAYIRFSIQSSTAPTWTQLELGSTATTYAPYNKQTLPISLGSIELCKLGTYQDYIYKDGENWKVHKALGKITLNGSEAWYSAGGNAPFGLAIDGALITTSDDNPPLVYCDKFYPVSQNASWSSYESLISTNNTSSSTKTIRIRYTDMASLSAFRTWLGDNNTILYYALATATDTTITDQTLIAQLEAVRNATLQASNTITNTATGTNLAGDLELGYCEYNPTNRYDKWLWLDLNNNYEKIGS